MIQVVMPLAGRGERFRQTGYEIPKPLIPLRVHPLFTYPLVSLGFQPETDSLTIISFQDQLPEELVRQSLSEVALLPRNKENYNFVRLETRTRGALETCSHAFPFLDVDKPVILLDSDMAFLGREFLTEMRSNPPQSDGALLSFEANNPAYSYAKSVDGYVTETAEKKVISSQALAGCYLFSKAAHLLLANNYIAGFEVNEEFPELYTAPFYNHLINDHGKKIRIFPSDLHVSFGTPQEFENCGPGLDQFFQSEWKGSQKT